MNICNLMSAVVIGFSLSATVSVAKTNKKIVLGFSQIGAESAWRVANSKSIKESAADAGVVLVFSDGQQLQANQIKAVKTFILQKVDVIAISPVITSGWREVLLLAKKAKIPVILVDRGIDAEDEDLYTSYIGSDFMEEGRRAGKCLVDVIKQRKMASQTQVNIVELRGTEGAAPATLRKKGFDEAIATHSNFKITHSVNGDFKESVGKAQMETILKNERAEGHPIHAVFAHNDNMALGAIASIEAAGLKPGTDISVVSVDAIRDAFVAMKAGKLNCTVECSPMLGPQLMKAVIALTGGEKLPRQIITQETYFAAPLTDAEFAKRQY